MATVIDSIAPVRSRRTGVRVTATVTGIVGALLAVIAGSLFDVRPPDAYGLCMACHARDLVDWTVNAAAGTRLTVAPASLVFPVLTPIGVLLGALLAARTSGEFRWQHPEHPVKTFLYGVVVMNCALLAGGCSIRLLLRTAAGETLGLIGFGALAAGVIVATQWLRWRAAR
jgi:hypothetical protein